jgi:type I restriction enzyme S subunit
VKLPSYPKYEPSDIDWLGDVPKHWKVKRGRFCMLVNPNSDRLRKLTADDEVSFVPMEAVGEFGGLRLDVAKPLDEIAGSYTEFQDGDVVVAKITPCFENGKVALAEGLTNGAALGTTELHVLRARDSLDQRFLFYLTLSSPYRKTGEAEMYGAGGQKRVPGDFNKDFRTPLPPIDEQCVIADFLDRETARLDMLVGKKRELIEKLKEKRTALISRTVTHGLNPSAKLKSSGIEWLGDIPEHWEVKKLSWLFRYCKGPNAATLTKEYVGSNTGDFPVYSGQTENEGLLGMIDDYAFGFAAPVIFVTTVGARAMTTRLVSGKFSLSQNCALIIPRTAKLSVQYYNGVLRRLFDFERRSISLIMQPSLRFEDLHKFRVPRPPAPEQRAIAEYLDRETGKIDKMIEKVEAASEKLQEYRTALITAVVTGKIDVRKAADSAVSTPGPATSTLPA